MRKLLLSFFFSVTSFASFAQELKVSEKIVNPTNVINDGFIELEVEGGTPPYQYKWSNQSTSLDSPRAENLIEGVRYSVRVTDAAGNSSGDLEFTVPAEAITEHFNGTF